MVRVDGRKSSAVVLSVETEVDGNVGMLFLDLEAPMSEIERWKDGQPVYLEARWKPTYIRFPFHPSLTSIFGSGSVQGTFVVYPHISEDHLYVLLYSAGDLKPL